MIGLIVCIGKGICRVASAIVEKLFPKRRAKAIAALSAFSVGYLVAVMLIEPIYMCVAKVAYMVTCLIVLSFIWMAYWEREEVYVLS